MLSLQQRTMNLAAPEIVRSLEQFCSQKNLNILSYQNLFNPEKRTASPPLITSPLIVEVEDNNSSNSETLFKK